MIIIGIINEEIIYLLAKNLSINIPDIVDKVVAIMEAKTIIVGFILL